MDATYTDHVRSIRRSTKGWAQLGLRLAVVALVAKPALSKFLTYGNSVAFFDGIGMPTPAVMVVVAGLIEVGAVALLLVGTGERFAAISLVPVMLVAILFVGPDWKNVSVLFASLALVALETDSTPLRWSPHETRG